MVHTARSSTIFDGSMDQHQETTADRKCLGKSMNNSLISLFDNKQLLDEVFVIIFQNNQGQGNGYQPMPKAEVDNPYLSKNHGCNFDCFH